MRRGVRIGVDVGRARVGVARCDRDGLLATPVETIQRASTDVVARLAELVRELEAIEAVVGLPVSLSGGDTPSTQDARDVAALLAGALADDGVPVRLVDERLSTVTAAAGMRASGRSARQQRAAIDQAAAVVILQHALDSERAAGRAPGELLTDRGDAATRED